jgi:hypothetical protein
MQLVAYGAQDVYLTGNPQITFFKVVYRRHTNFAMESMQLTLSGNNNLGGRGSCKLARNGDLVGACYLELNAKIDTGAEDKVNNRLGFNMIKSVELRIGGQRIDRQSSTWMLVWTNLTSSVNKSLLLDKMVGGNMSLPNNSLRGKPVTTAGGASKTSKNETTGHTLQIPLQFSFCRNPGLALPLIALQYHDVEIIIDYETAANCCVNATGAAAALSIGSPSLWVNYIFLDTEERKNFAQKSHEYLIETVQEHTDSLNATSDTPTVNNVRLNFNHPVKELVWVGRASTLETNGDKFTDFTASDAVALGDGNGLTGGLLKLNGQDRFAQMDTNTASSVDNPSKFFNCVQSYNYHSGAPARGVNVYSFALNPEEHQPSGTCNFSRIDNAVLQVTAPKNLDKIVVMAHGYNVLRVASGMGGLAYSN